MAEITIKGLNKTFGGLAAVKDLNLKINDGEFICFLGPSGCGKSTTLRIIAGLETSTSGDVYIGNENVTKARPRDRDIAMVFENYALYPHLTVYDNIAFPLVVRKRPKDEIKKEVSRIVDILQLHDVLDEYPSKLGDGQKQRVSIGRAIIREPAVFLMDEPISHLDFRLRNIMRIEIKRLHEEMKKTTIYVTHDQMEGISLADRIVIMNHGVLQQFGTPDEIFNSPVNMFVAYFVGEPQINLLKGNLFKKGDSLFFKFNNGDSIKIFESSENKNKLEAYMAKGITIGIRPTEIYCCEEKIEENSICGEVYIVETVGDYNIVNIKFDDEMLRIEVSSDFIPAVGQKVWFWFNQQKMHFFDSETENNILL